MVLTNDKESGGGGGEGKKQDKGVDDDGDEDDVLWWWFQNQATMRLLGGRKSCYRKRQQPKTRIEKPNKAPENSVCKCQEERNDEQLNHK